MNGAIGGISIMLIAGVLGVKLGDVNSGILQKVSTAGSVITVGDPHADVMLKAVLIVKVPSLKPHWISRWYQIRSQLLQSNK